MTGTAPGRAADSRAVRQHNLSLALRAVARSAAPVSRAGIAAATGMTRATASSLVDSLLAAGVVREVAPRAGPRGGRPATGLVLAERGPAVLGLELRVEAVAVRLARLSGAVVLAATEPVAPGDGADPRGRVHVLGRLAARAVRAADAAGLRLAGAALAVPGLVGADGVVRTAPNLGWRDVDVLALARREPALAGLGLTVDNEANLAALGELSVSGPGAGGPGAGGPKAGGPVGGVPGGAAGDVGPGVPGHGVCFLHVSGGVGVGAGVVVDGALYRGRHGWSGELGHVGVDPCGPRCRCGARGCLEQYAGLRAIAAASGLGPAAHPAATASAGRPAGAVGAGTAPAGADPPGTAPTGTEDVLAALRAAAGRGEPATLAALRRAGEALGFAVAGALNLLDLDRVVLGGCYAALHDHLAPAVRGAVAARVLSARWAPVSVSRSRLAQDAAVAGAVHAVVERLLADPAALLAGPATP